MKGLNDPVFALDEQEQKLLTLAFVQMMVVKVLLYFATEKGKFGFVPVPAMIAAWIVKAVYVEANGVEAKFLPYNRLVEPYYPHNIFEEKFWWNFETIEHAQYEVQAIVNIPDAMRAVVAMLIGEHSVLHPEGLLGMRMASWWTARPCGNHHDNLFMRLTKMQLKEAEDDVIRLGDHAAWCEKIGAEMKKYNDQSLVDSRCSECHSTL
jgi:hypothetical protein